MTDVKMTETEVLDAEKTALVVIDLQNIITSLAPQLAPNSAEQVIGQASKLAQAFMDKGGFVVLV